MDSLTILDGRSGPVSDLSLPLSSFSSLVGLGGSVDCSGIGSVGSGVTGRPASGIGGIRMPARAALARVIWGGKCGSEIVLCSSCLSDSPSTGGSILGREARSGVIHVDVYSNACCGVGGRACTMNATTNTSQGKRNQVANVRVRSGCMPRRVVASSMVRRWAQFGVGYRPSSKVGVQDETQAFYGYL